MIKKITKTLITVILLSTFISAQYDSREKPSEKLGGIIYAPVKITYSDSEFADTAIYEIIPQKEPLAAAFVKNTPPYWTSDPAKGDTDAYALYHQFLSVNPSENQTYDVELPEKKVTGLELRQNLVIFNVGLLYYSKENAKGELINPKTQREFNKVLFGNEIGATTQADKEQAKKVLNRMNDVVKGYFRAEKAKQTDAVQKMPDFSNEFINRAFTDIEKMSKPDAQTTARE